ncbi:hypothetical protein [Paracoccus sp. MC1862]|uniref:hypothetical protein n=1 Tax=Paracoccus sp. MC1862 TaxID=2760307 RepID=UPI00160038DA|nr:hypothetical protein [Paracoccus sp. MC1862]MBB1499181.1 hypothetical protein [Paracoccus sp. MC1862]
MKHTSVSRPVTLEDLQAMHRMAAALVIADPVYIPIFERIERELAAHASKQDSVARARAILAGQKASA